MVLLGVGFRAEGKVVVQRFPDLAELEGRRRGAFRPPGRSFPKIEVAEDGLDGRVILDQGNQAHWAAAFRAEQRVHVPDFLDQVAPGAGWDAVTGVG